MLKKILSSMANLTLIAGSVITTTAWTEYKNQNRGNTQKQNSQSSQNYSMNDPNYFNENSSIPDDSAPKSIYAYNGVIYVATLYNDLWESSDNGITFTKIFSVPSSFGDTVLNQVYAYNGVIYVIAGSVAYSLWESTDNGATWNQNTSLPSDEVIYSIYAYDNIVYIAELDGLYELTDGQTFKKASLIPSCEVVYAYKKIIYVGTAGYGFWESTDNGKTFHRSNFFPISVNYIYAYKSIIYVLSEGNVFESTDNGASWNQNTSFPVSKTIDNIYAYNGVVYVGTEKGLFESTDNDKTFTQKSSFPFPLSISESVRIDKVYAYNGVVYVGTDDGSSFDGLYESKPYTTLNKYNETINNYQNLLYDQNLLYSNPINFTFNWTLLQQVIIVNHNSSIPVVTKVLSSGNYKIKNDGKYTVIFTFKDGDTIFKKFLLKTGYDFSHGINGFTYSKDPDNIQIWNLDIYINGATANLLDYLTKNSTSKYYSYDYLGVLINPRKEAMGSKVWSDFFSNQTLKKSINDVGNKIDPGLEDKHNLYNTLSGGNTTTKDASILNYGETTYDNFRTNLHTNINDKNSTKEKPDNYSGIDLHFEFQDEASASWQVNNFNKDISSDAYNAIVQSQSN